MTKTARRPAEKSRRLTRSEWIEEGLRALAEQGEAGVRVDVIAKKLNISRGSFYWHFEDRPAYLSAILEEWRRSSTTFIQERLDRGILTPAERLRLLLKASRSSDQRVPGGPIERAVEQWASYNSEAAEMLANIHRERLGFCEALFTKLGHKAPAAMAEILYSYIVGRNQIGIHAMLQIGVHSTFDRSLQDAIMLEILGIGPEAGEGAQKDLQD